MHSVFRRSLSFAILLSALFLSAPAVPRVAAQGGEPLSFAIRGATIVPVSGPRIENGTVMVSHGLITAVGQDVTFPQETWIIDGKGLTVYPGLFDSFTDIGLVASAPSTNGESAGRSQQGQPQSQATSRGPEAQGWHLSRPGRGACPWGPAQWRHGCEISRRDSGFIAACGQFHEFSRVADGHPRLCSPGLAGCGLEHQSRNNLRQESTRRGAPSLRPHELRARGRAGRSRACSDPRE
jgi:hypothetical protein